MTRRWWNTSSFDLLLDYTFSNINLSQIFETLTEGASSDLSRETITQLVLPSEEEVVIDLSKSSSFSDQEPLECNFGSSYDKMPDTDKPTTNNSQSPSGPISFFDPKSQMTAHNENIKIRSTKGCVRKFLFLLLLRPQSFTPLTAKSFMQMFCQCTRGERRGRLNIFKSSMSKEI